MNKILKFIAQFIIIWVSIALVTLLTYVTVAEPILKGYEINGWTGALAAVVGVTIVYSTLTLLLFLFAKLLDYAFDTMNK